MQCGQRLFSSGSHFISFAENAENSVPECDPFLQRLNSSIFGHLPFRMVRPANRHDKFPGHWTVLIAIDFYVSMQVIQKLVKLSSSGRIEFVDNLLEEIGEKVFATEKKRRRDRAKIASLDDGKSMFDKSLCCL